MDEKFTPEEVLEICRVCGSTVASCKGCPGFREHSCTVDSVTLQARDALAALIEENKRLREERRWIPTLERNPDRELEEEPKGGDGKPLLGGYECIALIEGAKRPTALWYCDLDGERVWTDETGENLYRVTHWKPMPKGPEVGHD